MPGDGTILIGDPPVEETPVARVQIHFPTPGVDLSYDPAGIDPSFEQELKRILRTIQVSLRELREQSSIQEEIQKLPRSQREAVRRLDDMNLGEGVDPYPTPPEPPADEATDADELPQLRRLDSAVSRLNRVRPGMIPGSGPKVQADLPFRITVENYNNPADVGRPVQVNVLNTITSRINRPPAPDQRVFDTTIEDTLIRLEKPIDVPAMVTDPRLAGEEHFPLPADGELTGQFDWRGNYGTVLLTARFTDHRENYSQDMRHLTVKGPFEEEERRRENARFTREQRKIRNYASWVGAIRGTLGLLSGAIEAGTNLADAIPVIGGVIALTWRMLRSILNGLSNSILTIWSILQETWLQQNEAVNRANLGFIGMLPESGPAGAREVLQ